MAREPVEVEPAFAWAVYFTAGGLVLLTASATSFVLAPLTKALAALGTAHLLVGAGLTGAMAEPVPRRPEEGGAPIRLRLSWALLGLLPPPVLWVRLLLCAGVAALTRSGEPSRAAAGLLVLVGALLARPASARRMGLGEAAFFALAAFLGGGAVFAVFDEDSAGAWRGAALLAALLPLAGQRAREITAFRWKELLPGVPPPPALDLSRYELSIAKKEAPKALPAGVEARLVDAGSFRVDPARMLEKLRRYQLRDAEDFLLAWLRCAVRSGAQSIDLDRAPGGLTLRFDGRAFSAAELSSPYHVLLDGEAEEAERGRHFAYGLMALYRLDPRRLVVTSRGTDGVASMSVGGPAPAPETAPAGTVIRVEWPLWSFWRPFLLTARARRAWGLASARLRVNGYVVPSDPQGGEWRTLRRAGWRGAYRWSGEESRLRLYVHGTLVEELTEDLPREVESWLTHDELRLDISQSAVVRGSLLDEGLRALRGVT